MKLSKIGMKWGAFNWVSSHVWHHQSPPVSRLPATQSLPYAAKWIFCQTPPSAHPCKHRGQWCHHPVCARSLFRVMSPRLKRQRRRWKTVFVLCDQWKFGVKLVDWITSRLFLHSGALKRHCTRLYGACWFYWCYHWPLPRWKCSGYFFSFTVKALQTFVIQMPLQEK